MLLLTDWPCPITFPAARSSPQDYTIIYREGHRGRFGPFIPGVGRVSDRERARPAPDPALFKRWRDEFSFDVPDFYNWLELRGLAADGGIRGSKKIAKGD